MAAIPPLSLLNLVSDGLWAAARDAVPPAYQFLFMPPPGTPEWSLYMGGFLWAVLEFCIGFLLPVDLIVSLLQILGRLLTHREFWEEAWSFLQQAYNGLITGTTSTTTGACWGPSSPVWWA